MGKGKRSLFGKKSGMRRIERERLQYRDMEAALHSSLRIITALVTKMGGEAVITKEDLQAVEHRRLGRQTREDGSLEFVVERQLSEEEIKEAIANQETPLPDEATEPETESRSPDEAG